MYHIHPIHPTVPSHHKRSSGIRNINTVWLGPSDGISYRQNRRIVSSTSGARDKASYISNST